MKVVEQELHYLILLNFPWDPLCLTLPWNNKLFFSHLSFFCSLYLFVCHRMISKSSRHICFQEILNVNVTHIKKKSWHVIVWLYRNTKVLLTTPVQRGVCRYEVATSHHHLPNLSSLQWTTVHPWRVPTFHGRGMWFRNIRQKNRNTEEINSDTEKSWGSNPMNTESAHIYFH